MFKICFSSDPLCVPDKIPFFTQDMSSAAPESLCQLDIMVIDYMFTSKNVSSENRFVFVISQWTYVGHGLVLNWLNPENFVQWTQIVHSIEKNQQVKGQLLLCSSVAFIFGDLIIISII